MIVFWLLASLMVGAGLALLLPPLLRPRSGETQDGLQEASLAANRLRLQALQTQLAEGSLSPEAYDDAQRELERQVLADAISKPKARQQPRAAPLSAALVLIVLPAMSVGLYHYLGDRQALHAASNPNLALESMLARLDAQSPVPAQFSAQVDALDSRLRADPHDLQGWRLLARSRVVLGQFQQAEAAMEEALALSGEATQDLVDYVEASSMANQMRFPARAQTRIEQALSVEPENPRALMLGALAAIQRGEPALALTRFKAVLATQPPDGERAQFLRGLIARVENTATTQAAPAVQSDAAQLRIQVRLDANLTGAVSGDQRVFVFARAAEGPPMPLAVATLNVSDLPAEVVLDDTQSMVPGRTLSSAAQVIVGARVSMSGSATPASGDLEGLSSALDPRTQAPVEIVINRRRQ